MSFLRIGLLASLVSLLALACLPAVERSCDDDKRGTIDDPCCYPIGRSAANPCPQPPASSKEKTYVCRERRCLPQICTPGQTEACPFGGIKGATSFTCQPAFRICVDQGVRWSACQGGTPPRPEICDGLDNDCNGKVDEGLSCACDPAKEDVRPCLSHPNLAATSTTDFYRSGMQTCLPKRPSDGTFVWSGCLGQSAPSLLPTSPTPAFDACTLIHLSYLPAKEGEQKDIPAADGLEDTEAPGLTRCPCDKEGEERSCLELLRFSCSSGEAQSTVSDCPFAKGCEATTLFDSDKKPRKEGLQTCQKHPTSKNLVWSSCRASVIRLKAQTDYKGKTFPPALEQNARITTSVSCNEKDDDCDGFIDNVCGFFVSSGAGTKAYPLWESCTDGLGPSERGFRLCAKDNCPQGGVSCPSLQCTPKELCGNGYDDDGDGKVDETPCETPSSPARP